MRTLRAILLNTDSHRNSPIQQVRTAFEHWGRFQAILADKGKQNLIGVKFETTVD